jgi:Ca2+-binding EF-hand superfamily protein
MVINPNGLSTTDMYREFSKYDHDQVPYFRQSPLVPLTSPRQSASVRTSPHQSVTCARLRYGRWPKGARARGAQSQYLDLDEFIAMQGPELRAKLGDDAIRAMFDAADLDGDGRISTNEFFVMNGWMEAPSSTKPARTLGRVPPPPPASPPQPLTNTMAAYREFAKYDVDQSQMLDFDEFVRMQSDTVLANLTMQEMREIFNDADTDGNGSLDFNEFFKLHNMVAAYAAKKNGFNYY